MPCWMDAGVLDHYFLGERISSAKYLGNVVSLLLHTLLNCDAVKRSCLWTNQFSLCFGPLCPSLSSLSPPRSLSFLLICLLSHFMISPYFSCGFSAGAWAPCSFAHITSNNSAMNELVPSRAFSSCSKVLVASSLQTNELHSLVCEKNVVPLLFLLFVNVIFSETALWEQGKRCLPFAWLHPLAWQRSGSNFWSDVSKGWSKAEMCTQLADNLQNKMHQALFCNIIHWWCKHGTHVSIDEVPANFLNLLTQYHRKHAV